MFGKDFQPYNLHNTLMEHKLLCSILVNSSDETGLPRDMQIPQRLSGVQGVKKKQQTTKTHSIPLVKPQISRSNVSSPRSDNEKGDLESVKSVASLVRHTGIIITLKLLCNSC